MANEFVINELLDVYRLGKDDLNGVEVVIFGCRRLPVYLNLNDRRRLNIQGDILPEEVED